MSDGTLVGMIGEGWEGESERRDFLTMTLTADCCKHRPIADFKLAIANLRFAI